MLEIGQELGNFVRPMGTLPVSPQQPTLKDFLWTQSVHLRNWRCDLYMGSAAISLSAALGFMSELITLGSQRGHPYVRIGFIRLS